MIGKNKTELKNIANKIEKAIKNNDSNIINKLMEENKGLKLEYKGDGIIQSNIEFTGRYVMEGYTSIKSLKEGLLFIIYNDNTVGVDVHCTTIDKNGYYNTEFVNIIK